MTDRVPLDDMTSDRLDQLYDQLDRLRDGEQDGWDERIVPTPGQWIARWNQATAEKRLDVAARIIDSQARAARCFEMNHEKRLDAQQHAEATLARVRELRDKWLLMTLEPGQVRRLLDGLTAALDGEQQ